jgi:predicted nucleic acid-binding protein
LILVDANVFMYAAGSEHPYKASSNQFLLRIARGEIEAAVDTEVLQEILHRYRAMGRWQEGRRVYDAARRIVLVSIPITGEIMDGTRDLLDTYPSLTVRDALHAAATLHTGAEGLCSYDRDFDDIKGLHRIEP